MTELLKIDHVSKHFGRGNKETQAAVDAFSLKIKEGECTAIVGESGCGKSTLVRMILGIEKPTEGHIYYQGVDIAAFDQRQLRKYRREVQMIFQNPEDAISPRMKIGTFLMEPWRHFERMSYKMAKEQALYALSRVHLEASDFNKYPHQLSGGQLQRVVIARAIALHPKLLICDEATSALDVSVQKQIVGLLKEHQEKTNNAILFICHDLALAKNLSSRMIVMDQGRIVEELDSQSFEKQAKHPYTKNLLSSMFSIGENSSTV